MERTTWMPTLMAALGSGCAISTAYRETSSRAGGATVVVAATHARIVEGGRKRFDESVSRVVASLPRQPGLHGYSLRRHLWRDEYWTFTVWESRAAFLGFLAGTVHRDAVREAGASLAFISYLDFDMATSRLLPAWPHVLARLAAREAQP